MLRKDEQQPPGRLAIVVPTRRLEANLAERIKRWHAQLAPEKVIVVTPADIARAAPPPGLPAGCRVIDAPRGRGTQCNAGARASQADWLLFLHDDTELPGDAAALIRNAMDDATLGMACFRLRFDRAHPLLAFYAWWSRWDSVWTTFGDQGYLLRRTLFDAVGGFPDWPLFEDVELASRVRRLSGPMRRIRKLPTAVTTSATRFEQVGIARQQLRNAIAMLRFFAGTAPSRLADDYERPSPRSSAGTSAERNIADQHRSE